MKIRITAAVMAACVFSISPAHAIQLQPGEWQETTSGTEDGKPVPPDVDKSCLGPEEARDATNVVKQMKSEMQEQAGQCQTFDVKENGNTVVFTMKCGDGKQFMLDIAGTFTFVSATRYTGTMKSTMGMAGKMISQDKIIEAVRVGDCKPGSEKKN
ncbi:MAG: DUF3617 family protein [Pseudolabrys sp.]|nr:DUF3617 family protein [Pseudolabrys sp.]